MKDMPVLGRGVASVRRFLGQRDRLFAAVIGSREAVVILEPDALAGMTCLSAQQQAERVDMLSYATLQFAAKAPSAKVYLDIGHTGWLGRDKAVELLQAGVANIRGFSPNVSNFRWQASDGCAAAAGTFDPDLAIRLIQGG